jgi:hypothetical protein
MHNWYAMETEAEFRRQEWEREVIAETRAAQAQPNNGRFHWPRLPRLALPTLRMQSAAPLHLTPAIESKRPGVAC